MPYYNYGKGQGSVYAAVDEYTSHNQGTYIGLYASKYQALLKQFYYGALTFQVTDDGGASWTDLLRFDEANLSAAFGGVIYEQGTALSNKYITQKGGQIINFSKSSYVKTSSCDGYAINHIGTLAICMEVNRNTTWSDCHLGTVSIKPYHTVRTTVVLQDSGLSIPLRINTDGNVYLEIKGITPGTSGWIYGGITYYYN